MENPHDFPKALALLQISDISMYCVVALVVYRYAGTDVTSPAFGSAGPTIAKVAYGIAIPTVCPSHLALGSSDLILDHHRRCYLRPRFFHLHIHTCLPKVPHAEDMEGMGPVGWYHTGSLDCRLGHRTKVRSPLLATLLI
jgi:hypothetical protein